MVDVSIIIINYNSFQLIMDLLESFYKYHNSLSYEIIIVDNGSCDDSIIKLKNRFVDIKFIENGQNLGFAAANNIGLEKAIGKFVLFLNNDILFHENTLEKIVEYYEELKSPILIGCKLLNKDGSLQKSVYDFVTLRGLFCSISFLYLIFPKTKYFNKYYLMNQNLSVEAEVDVIVGAFMFAENKNFKVIGGFDEKFFFYGEDEDLCLRFKNSVGRVIYYPDTAITHLKGSSANKNMWFQEYHRSISTIILFRKHFKGIKYLLALFLHYFGILLRIPILFAAGIITFRKSFLIKMKNYLKLLLIYPKRKRS